MKATSILSRVSPTGALVVIAALAACANNKGGSGGESLGSTASAIVTCPPQGTIIPNLPPLPSFQASTVPAIGDVNPYGIAFVPSGFPPGGIIGAGDLIVANFNNRKNLQGTGTTVVKVNPGAKPDLFYRDDKHPGFSTALGVMSAGFVFLGNVPSSDGSGACNGNQANVGNGSLMIIDKRGNLVTRLEDDTLLAGPWDLTVDDQGSTGTVYVSNVNSGTVTRLNISIVNGAPTVTGKEQIAHGYLHRCDPAAFVVGPTGLAYDHVNDVLYVAAASYPGGANDVGAIFSIANASITSDMGMGNLVVSDAKHFHGPLGLVRAANGDLVSAQGDAVNPDPNQQSQVVEVDSNGSFVREFGIDPGAGAAFGIALTADGSMFAAVDDANNTAIVWPVQPPQQ
jgi:hypothetical protein